MRAFPMDSYRSGCEEFHQVLLSSSSSTVLAPYPLAADGECVTHGY